MPEPGTRRTVVIRGQVVERYSPRREPAHAARTAARQRARGSQRTSSRPDRIAMWAVLLGVLLLLAAATSSHAAVIHAAASHLPHLAAAR